MSLFAWDTETWKIQPGLLSPPIVCHSFADGDPFGEQLLRGSEAKHQLLEYLTKGATVAGANIAYDFGCLLAEDSSLFPLVWKVYEEGRVHDVLIASTLRAISEGRLRDGELYDLKGQKMKDEKGRMTSRYSLFNSTREWLGREDAKRNDRFRTSYALLGNIPLEYWPDDARQYPIDDAVNTLEVADVNHDQKPDLIAGNMGENTQVKVSEAEPAELYYRDFDGNGCDASRCRNASSKSGRG